MFSTIKLITFLILRTLIILFSVVYSGSVTGQQNKLIMPMGHTTKADDIKFINNDKFVITHSTNEQKAYVWDIRTGRLLKTLADSSFSIVEGNNNKYFAVASNTTPKAIYIYSKKNAELVNRIILNKKPDDFFIRTRLSFSGTEDSLIVSQIGTENSILINVKSGKILQDEFNLNFLDYLELISFGIKDTFYSKKPSLLKAIPTDSGTIFIHKTNTKGVVALQKTYTVPTSLTFSEDDKICLIGTDNGSVFVYSLEQGKMIHTLKTAKQEITASDISLNKTIVAAASVNGDVFIWDLKNNKIVKKIINVNTLQSIRFDHTGKYLLGTSSKFSRTNGPHWSYTAFLWNVEKSILVSEIKDYRENIDIGTMVGASNSGMDERIFFTSPSGEIRFDSSAQRFLYILEVDSVKLQFRSRMLTYDGKWVSNINFINPFAELNRDEKAQVSTLIKQQFGSQVKGFIEHDQINILDLQGKSLNGTLMSNHSKYYFLNSNTGLKLYDAITNKLISDLFLFNSLGYIMKIPTEYYASSPSASKLVHYVTPELQVISFEQLDVKYNRPDLVLIAIGNKDTNLISSYRRAYEKRINRLGIDTTAFNESYGLPQIDFVERDKISYEQISPKLKLHIRGTATSHSLERFNVWVNEVPLYGIKGISLKGRGLIKFDTTITILLSQGVNLLETSIVNKGGIESYHMPLQLSYSASPLYKPRLHFIGIGIDRFKDSRNNLRYCVKDIRDLALNLKSKYGEYIRIDTLFNEQVTIQRIKELKKALLNTNVNDKVILSYSGHGLLSQEYDYYLSTYNVNFKKPAQYGLPYEALESLLDGIPPRKKLMLIDACHSGEVDKEEMAKLKKGAFSLSAQGTSIVTKGVEDTEYDNDKNLGMKNSFELMQELFVNVGKNTGATIISAAGGTQFAQERGELKNGVFTYCILELMKEKKEVTVFELKNYVNRRVTELTDGMQVPTTRSEIKAVDWNVW